MTQLFRSLIFVPGNNSKFLEKAKKFTAKYKKINTTYTLTPEQLAKRTTLNKQLAINFTIKWQKP